MFKFKSAKFDNILRFTVAGATTSLDTVADCRKLIKALSESILIGEEIKVKKILKDFYLHTEKVEITFISTKRYSTSCEIFGISRYKYTCIYF